MIDFEKKDIRSYRKGGPVGSMPHSVERGPEIEHFPVDEGKAALEELLGMFPAPSDLSRIATALERIADAMEAGPNRHVGTTGPEIVGPLRCVFKRSDGSKVWADENGKIVKDEAK